MRCHESVWVGRCSTRLAASLGTRRYVEGELLRTCGCGRTIIAFLGIALIAAFNAVENRPEDIGYSATGGVYRSLIIWRSGSAKALSIFETSRINSQIFSIRCHGVGTNQSIFLPSLGMIDIIVAARAVPNTKKPKTKIAVLLMRTTHHQGSERKN